MGIHQKIIGLFLLASTPVYSQEKPCYFQPSLLRASATIAPTRFYTEQTTVALIDGFVEYVLENRISVRGEGNIMAPNGKLLYTNSPEKFPRNYTSIYAGFGYHIGKRNWKHSIHLEPGVSITEIAQDNYNISYKWSANPALLVKVGTCLYVSRFFDFFAEINWSDSYVRNNPATSVSMAQVGISAGLGFHLLTKTKK